MTIKTTRNEGALNVSLCGRLDLLTSPELNRLIDEELEGVSELTIDLTELEYISSAGLRVLLIAKKKLADAGSMKLVNPNEMVREVFDITGFSDVFEIE